MLIATPSIMHTGTHLFENFIFRDFEPWPGYGVGGADYTYKVHYISSAMSMIEKALAEADFIVSPMRHPARILESFKRRQRSISLNDVLSIPYVKRPVIYGIRDGGDYETQWRNLAYCMSNYNIRFIHVDDFENRDAQVEQLAKDIGKELHPEWPINRHSGSSCNTHNLEITGELLDEVPAWILSLYELTK